MFSMWFWTQLLSKCSESLFLNWSPVPSQLQPPNFDHQTCLRSDVWRLFLPNTIRGICEEHEYTSDLNKARFLQEESSLMGFPRNVPWFLHCHHGLSSADTRINKLAALTPGHFRTRVSEASLKTARLKDGSWSR